MANLLTFMLCGYIMDCIRERLTMMLAIENIDVKIGETIWSVGDNIYTPFGITILRPVVEVRVIGDFGMCYAIDLGVAMNAYLPKWYKEADLLALNDVAR